MIGLLLTLYPASWRRRYGEEFRVVLESRPLGPYDFFDVLIGALDARLAFRSAEASNANGGPMMLLRIGGWGAIVGGALWVAGMIGGNAESGFSGLWFASFVGGSLGLLVALAGMSAFQAHREPRLAWAAFAIPAAGTLLTIAGIVGMTLEGEDPFVGPFKGWELWILGLLATLTGSILFAVATIRAHVFSQLAARALAASAVVALLVAFGMDGEADSTFSRLLIISVVGAFGSSWVALGVSAVRRGPIRAATAA